jgi:hypothetical protein
LRLTITGVAAIGLGILLLYYMYWQNDVDKIMLWSDAGLCMMFCCCVALVDIAFVWGLLLVQAGLAYVVVRGVLALGLRRSARR